MGCPLIPITSRKGLTGKTVSDPLNYRFFHLTLLFAKSNVYNAKHHQDITETEKMANIRIIYSTTDGHTLKICRRLLQVMQQQEHQVSLVSVDKALNDDLMKFDKIVIGASIRYGKHRPQVYEFIRRNEKILENKPSAFFSVNIVARKPEKNRPETNPYTIKFLSKISWQPKELAVFAGKIDYQRYSFWDRHIIRFIMWMTKGPTDPKAVIEYTNWLAVDAFGRRLSNMQ